jgi:hypothetical protein
MYLIFNEETSKAGAAGGTVSINFRIENIFNGLFESWNMGKNRQNLAEIQQNNTCESAVNPTGINHSRPLREIDGLLRLDKERENVGTANFL